MLPKPLHVGHLRSAIIGESIKRIGRFVGHKVIGDVHLGDWGLQMGLIITELKHRQPELVYFDDSLYRGVSGGSTVYYQRAGGDLSVLQAAKSKEDEAYRAGGTGGNPSSSAGQAAGIWRSGITL